MTATAEAVDRSTPTTGRAARRGPSSAVLVAVLLVLATTVLSLWGTSAPERMYFDEKYYVNDALERLSRGVEEGRPVHPPLGTWLIAAGIEVVGDRPLGWRISAVVAGTLTVLLTFLVGRRLTGSTLLAGLAGLLVAVDGLAFTARRMGTLDVFLGLFVIAAVWLVLRDREARQARPGRWPSAVHGSRWRWASGLALGLAVATKWSGLLALLACGLVVLGVEASLGGPTAERVRRVLAATVGALLPLVVVPLAVYAASWSGWFMHYEDSYAGNRACAGQVPCEHGATQRLGTWADFHGELVRYHRDLEATHPYRSSPLAWPVQARPVLYYRQPCAPDPAAACTAEAGDTAVIRGIGNPALWWPALLAYPLLAWRVWRRRDAAAAVVLVVLLSMWLPWFAAGKPGYSFYLVPGVPFVALALAVAVAGTNRRRAAGALALLLAVVALAVFAYLWPVLVGVPLTEAAAERRYWLDAWG